MGDHDATSPDERQVASGVPHGGHDWAGPDDRCSCGRPAVIVYLTEHFGRVGFCGIPNGQPLPGDQAEVLIETGDDKRRGGGRRCGGPVTVTPDPSRQSGNPAARQQMLAAALRCHYADGTTNIQRPHCQTVAVVAYGPIALCDTCDKMRSAVGRTHPPRRLPGAELARLLDAARILAQAETNVTDAVSLALAAGASWSQIGDAVDVSRQRAQQRWRDLVDHAGLTTGVDTAHQPLGQAREVIATS